MSDSKSGPVPPAFWEAKTTRSGATFGYHAAPIDTLPRANDSLAKVCSSPQVLMAIMEKQLALIASTLETSTSNIAGLAAYFGDDAGRQRMADLYAYSSSAKLHPDTAFGLLDMVGKAADSGDFATQKNVQSRNHTEPKLVQEFADLYLYESSPYIKLLKWVWIVTDRACCKTCTDGTVKPFAKWCEQHGVGFQVFNLAGKLALGSPTPVPDTATSSSSSSGASAAGGGDSMNRSL